MTLTELLEPFGVEDDDFLTELASALRTPAVGSAELAENEQRFLDRFGGVRESQDSNATGRAWLHNTADNLAAQVSSSLTVGEIAAMLGITPSRVRHRVTERALYGFKYGNRLRLPRWQFHEDKPLPGLSKVLGALRADLHPLEVTGFMDNPQDSLVVHDEPLSPRDWLAGGGDPTLVADLAAQLGTLW